MCSPLLQPSQGVVVGVFKLSFSLPAPVMFLRYFACMHSQCRDVVCQESELLNCGENLQWKNCINVFMFGQIHLWCVFIFVHRIPFYGGLPCFLLQWRMLAPATTKPFSDCCMLGYAGMNCSSIFLHILLLLNFELDVREANVANYSGLLVEDVVLYSIS